MRQGWGAREPKKNLPDRTHIKTLCSKHLVWAIWKFTKLTEANPCQAFESLGPLRAEPLSTPRVVPSFLRHLLWEPHFIDSKNAGFTSKRPSSILKPRSFDFFGLCSGKAEKLLGRKWRLYPCRSQSPVFVSQVHFNQLNYTELGLFHKPTPENPSRWSNIF